MSTISHSGKTVTTGTAAWTVDYAVREAFEFDGKVIVLIDPDAYLADPGYPRERRRGADALRNLRAYDSFGSLVWEAELPEPADYYYRIVAHDPLTALSFSCFRCRIDPESGRIVEAEFTK